jgi:hypothetical protein
MNALFALLLAVAPVASDAPVTRAPVSRVAVATVTIIRAEPVEVRPTSSGDTKTDRQYRQRDSVPMVEFF